jgi:hypothetical protein
VSQGEGQQKNKEHTTFKVTEGPPKLVDGRWAQYQRTRPVEFYNIGMLLNPEGNRVLGEKGIHGDNVEQAKAMNNKK